jgi:hypothetical protein
MPAQTQNTQTFEILASDLLTALKIDQTRHSEQPGGISAL